MMYETICVTIYHGCEAEKQLYESGIINSVRNT